MSTRAPCPSELSVVASRSATGIPYWLTPAKITALPLFEFGAPTCRRSGESYIIRANTRGVRAGDVRVTVVRGVVLRGAAAEVHDDRVAALLGGEHATHQRGLAPDRVDEDGGAVDAVVPPRDPLPYRLL